MLCITSMKKIYVLKQHETIKRRLLLYAVICVKYYVLCSNATLQPEEIVLGIFSRPGLRIIHQMKQSNLLNI